ncbi:MAG: hypothetical protein JWN40_4207 [Phycisphaerales bacterium]|nr:hypothetical protein [Phycisphaerales bacterium]
MEQSIEERLCRRIEAVLTAIRERVLRQGMAVQWHIDKALDILDKPDRLKSIVVPLEEHEEARYLARLPALVAIVEEQDERCATAWEASGATSDGRAAYEREWLRLSTLLLEFRNLPRLYGKLVQYPRKPLLERARTAMSAPNTSPDEVIEIQRTVRMTLREFVALEDANATDVARWIALREELSLAYDDVALEIAMKYGSGQDILVAARRGLYLATGYYDYHRGYSFPEYAQHWVERGIQRLQDG